MDTATVWLSRAIQQNKVWSPHSQASVLTFSFPEQIVKADSWVLIENTALPLAVYFLWPLPGGSLNTYPVSWIAPDGIRSVWQEFCLSSEERIPQMEHFSKFHFKVLVSWTSNRLNVFLKKCQLQSGKGVTHFTVILTLRGKLIDISVTSCSPDDSVCFAAVLWNVSPHKKLFVKLGSHQRIARAHGCWGPSPSCGSSSDRWAQRG